MYGIGGGMDYLFYENGQWKFENVNEVNYVYNNYYNVDSVTTY